MRERILGSGFSLTLANLIGLERSHDKWERMHESGCESGCKSGFLGADSRERILL